MRSKDTEEIFIASFIYGSNCLIVRRELWREMNIVSRSVAGGTNPLILQSNFNVTKSAMEHSRFLDSAGENLAIREFLDIIRSCNLVYISHTLVRNTLGKIVIMETLLARNSIE